MFDSFRRTEHRRKPNSPPLSIKLSSASSYLCFREVRSTAARPLYFVRSYTKTHTSRCVDDRFFMVTKGWTVNPKKKTVTEFGQSWFFTVRIIQSFIFYVNTRLSRIGPMIPSLPFLFYTILTISLSSPLTQSLLIWQIFNRNK